MCTAVRLWLRIVIPSILLLTAVAAPVRSEAQQASVVSRIDVARQTTSTEATAGAPSDFRSRLGSLDVQVLGEPVTPQPWKIALGTNGSYTTNAQLIGPGHTDDYYLASTALFAYEPKLVDGLGALLAVRQDLFRYDKNHALNFSYLETDAGLTYALLPNTVASLRYVYTRLEEDAFGHGFFQDHAIALSVDSTWRYSQTFRFVYGAGAQVSLDADPSAGRRNDYGLHAALVCEPVEHLQLIAGYEGSYYDYGFAGRNDFNHVFRAGLLLRPTSWLWIGATVAYTLNRSNLDAFDYHAWTTGVGAGVEYHF